MHSSLPTPLTTIQKGHMQIRKSIPQSCEVRAGFVLLPDQTAYVSGELPSVSDLTGYAIAVSVPEWLTSEFKRPTPMKSRFGLVTPRDGSEPFLVLAMQSGNSQLRLLIRATSLIVQALLRDSAERCRLKLVLRVDGPSNDHVLTLGPQDLRSSWLDDVLRQTIQAKCNESTMWGALEAFSRIDEVPSLIPGHPVSKAVTAVIARALAI